MRKHLKSPQVLIVFGAALGLICGAYPMPGQMALARVIMTIFMNGLRLVSLPIVFLAVTTTIIGMDSLAELAWLGRRVLTFTFLTTLIAATVALGLFALVYPVDPAQLATSAAAPHQAPDYIEHLLHIVPSSFVQPFLDGNILGILFIAVAFGICMLGTPDRALVNQVLSGILAGLMRMTRLITQVVPIVVWAGMVESYAKLAEGAVAGMLLRYLGCVVAANLIQAFVILPGLLRLHKIAPWRSAKAFYPALSVAFFCKSSVATLPVAMRLAKDKLGVAPKVAHFSFPICTSINMNGCAAFILTTVLFVSMNHGRLYAPLEMVSWIAIATIAAVGNAGVPMGCFFLSSALLAAMDVPLTLMALILPFYSFIDMLETAVNVWSDACVAMLVNRKYQGRGLTEEASDAIATTSLEHCSPSH